MSTEVGRSPEDDNAVDSFEMENGDVVLYETSNPEAWIQVDEESAFDLDGVFMR